jgi:hypothetical protein
LLDQPGVSNSQGMVPVETSIFIQGFDGQTLDPTFLTGGIPIQVRLLLNFKEMSHSLFSFFHFIVD